MKKYIGLIAILFLIPSLGIAGDEIINGVLQEAGGSSEWTLSGTTITPTTATSTAAGYTSNVTTGVFQFGTQAAIGATYSPVTGGGRIGIGTTAPATSLDLTGTGMGMRSHPGYTASTSPATYSLAYALGDGDTGFYEYSDDVIVLATAGTARVMFDEDNTQAIRSVASNGFGLHNEASTETNPTMGPYGQGDATTGFGGNPTGAKSLSMIINSTQIAQANASGVSITGGLLVSGLAGAGALQADGTGQIIALSDESVKDLICPIKATLDDVAKLQGYRYTWKVGSGVNAGYEKDFPEVGFTAQGVQAAFPDLVNTKRVEQKRRVIGVDDKAEPIYEEYKELTDVPKLNYSTRGLVAYLVEALKDANNRIKALEAAQADILKRLEALEAK